MMNKYLEKYPTLFIALVLAAAVVLSFLTVPPAHSATVLAAEAPAKPEKNPPGDIPDDQVFIDYRSAQGFSLKVPEGWARAEGPDGVSFTDKFNGVTVMISSAASAPTVDSVKGDYRSTMEKSRKAVNVTDVRLVKLKGGSAVLISYSSNSEPNSVTNKQIRLENRRYLFFKDGRIAELDLFAPFGADNVDQWQLMSQSFRWL
jgi:hypothetical protein